MADTSRKRSRKSKLVPRECPMDEEDVEMQVPATKISKGMKERTNKTQKLEATTSILKPSIDTTPSSVGTTASNHETQEVCDTSVLRKINASVRNSIELDKESPRKFEINIEVESCDDDDDFKEEFPENKENAVSAGTDYVIEDPILFLKSEVDKAGVLSSRPIPLTLEGILETVDELQSSDNIANKIIGIYVRNTIGYESKTKLEFPFLETKIQKALEDWREWQSRSFHRGEPLFYKCYICTRSYWHLSDFRTHLTSNHAEDTKVNITLERYEMHEANLIAYHKRLVVIKDIYTPGLCYRCSRDYAGHEITLRFQEKYYKEEGCPRKFYCCTGLRDHFPTCTICNVVGKHVKCDICKLRFGTDRALIDHLLLSHSVRSDVPILTHHTNKRYSEHFESKYLHLHNCINNVLGNNKDCIHQQKGSPNAVQTHMKGIIPYKCEICGLQMRYNCMKYKHMLCHTDEYMVVNKCMACEGFNVFVSIDGANAHWSLKHETTDLKDSQNNFHKIFVPSSCIYQSLAELDLKEQESAMAEQESISGEEESISEVQESISEVQESISEVQESISEVLELDSDEESISEAQEDELESDEEESDIEEKPSLLDIDEGSVSAYKQEQLDSTDFKMENIIVKEEPEDSQDSTELVIKEEPLEEDNDDQTFEQENVENLDDQLHVKQEVVDDEIDEYDDLIKLNFDLEDLLVKDEPNVDEDTQESGNDYASEETSQDSIIEPKLIITGKKKKKNKKVYSCPCGFRAMHKEYREHQRYNCCKHSMKTRNFKCTKCINRFSSMKKFLHHFEEHGYPPLSCPECLKKFENFTTLGQHVQMHVRQNFVRVKMITYAGNAMSKPDFQCTKCSERIDSSEFFDHWETHIKGEPNNPVKVVPKAKKKEEISSNHLHETILKECISRLHMHPKQCNVCLRIFNRVNECKRHIIEHLLVDAYNQIKTYKDLRCQICDTGFPMSDKYKQHMRDHASLPVYKCELCDRTFSDSGNFTKHKKVHNLEVIVCDLCGKKFQSKLSLEKHIEKHRTTKPILCEICNKLFYFETTYRRHMRANHEQHTTEFPCVICGKRFRSLKLKWDHMWEVHEQRKQKADCPICQQSFRKYSDVRAHAKAVHLIAITVISIKSGKPQTASKKPKEDMPTYSNSKWPTLTVGPETETLVVYDSD